NLDLTVETLKPVYFKYPVTEQRYSNDTYDISAVRHMGKVRFSLPPEATDVSITPSGPINTSLSYQSGSTFEVTVARDSVLTRSATKNLEGDYDYGFTVNYTLNGKQQQVAVIGDVPPEREFAPLSLIVSRNGNVLSESSGEALTFDMGEMLVTDSLSLDFDFTLVNSGNGPINIPPEYFELVNTAGASAIAPNQADGISITWPASILSDTTRIEAGESYKFSGNVAIIGLVNVIVEAFLTASGSIDVNDSYFFLPPIEIIIPPYPDPGIGPSLEDEEDNIIQQCTDGEDAMVVTVAGEVIHNGEKIFENLDNATTYNGIHRIPLRISNCQDNIKDIKISSVEIIGPENIFGEGILTTPQTIIPGGMAIGSIPINVRQMSTESIYKATIFIETDEKDFTFNLEVVKLKNGEALLVIENDSFEFDLRLLEKSKMSPVYFINNANFPIELDLSSLSIKTNELSSTLFEGTINYKFFENSSTNTITIEEDEKKLLGNFQITINTETLKNQRFTGKFHIDDTNGKKYSDTFEGTTSFDDEDIAVSIDSREIKNGERFRIPTGTNFVNSGSLELRITNNGSLPIQISQVIKQFSDFRIMRLTYINGFNDTLNEGESLIIEIDYETSNFYTEARYNTAEYKLSYKKNGAELSFTFGLFASRPNIFTYISNHSRNIEPDETFKYEKAFKDGPKTELLAFSVENTADSPIAYTTSLGENLYGIFELSPKVASELLLPSEKESLLISFDPEKVPAPGLYKTTVTIKSAVVEGEASPDFTFFVELNITDENNSGLSTIRLTQGSNIVEYGHNDTNPYSFPETELGVPLSRTFRVYNDGNTVFDLVNLEASPGFMVNPAPFSLSIPPGEYRNFFVEFLAEATGTTSGQVTFERAGFPGEPFIFNVEGTASGATTAMGIRQGGGTWISEGDVFDFGTSSAFPFRIYNLGYDHNLNINSID
ncbi:hypothetical protein, partial [Leptobacterium sp. I13]|uniref:hypothetical protein n=1 Tax=Leptobacterium meishanense TaxID=3128904 RepID=UPI0030EC2726